MQTEMMDHNSSEHDIQKHLTGPLSAPEFHELTKLKHEMENRGTLLGKTWSELSRIMTKYQAKLVEKHDQLDSVLSAVNHSKMMQIHQDIEKCKKDELQQRLTEMETKLMDRDSEIVQLRTEVYKYKNLMSVKNDYIQTLEKRQTVSESADNPITSPPQPAKRRKIRQKPQAPRSSVDDLYPTENVAKKEPLYEIFQYEVPGPSTAPMDSVQSFNAEELQEQGFFTVDEVLDPSESGNAEGMPGQEQDTPKVQKQIVINVRKVRRAKEPPGMRIVPAVAAKIGGTKPLTKLQCKFCQKKLSSLARLRGHIATVHNQGRAFGCPHCQYQCAKEWRLQRHIAETHAKVTEECPVCEKQVQKSNMSRHVRMHDEGRPYLCAVCPAMFKRKDSLLRHAKKH